MPSRVIELLSSGDFEASAAEADRAALDAATGGNGEVLVLLTALAPEGSDVMAREGKRALAHFAGLGVPAQLAGLVTRQDAFRPDLAAAAETASMVFLAGGQPAYLASALIDTPLWAAVLAASERGATVAGCSAGMWVLGELAPVSTITDLADHAWVPGLRLVPGAVLAAHWDALDSFLPGLQGAVRSAVPPDWTLLAIDERTAVWWGTGCAGGSTGLARSPSSRGPCGARSRPATTSSSSPAGALGQLRCRPLICQISPWCA